MHSHTHALAHTLPHTQTFIHWDKWVIVFWIQHGIFQFNILSLLGIDTLFLPHSTGERKPLCVCLHVCVCVRVCGDVWSYQQWHPSGNDSSGKQRSLFIHTLNFPRYVQRSCGKHVKYTTESSCKTRNKKNCIYILFLFKSHHDWALQGKLLWI